MKSKIGIGVIALLLFFTFLVAYVPANQVLGRVELPNNISISGVTGTFWNGNARNVVVNGLPIKDVSWNLSALPLLWGSVALDLDAGNQRRANEISFAGELTTGLSGEPVLASDNFILYLPTDQVLANVQLPIPVIAGGRFRVTINELDFDQKCAVLTGRGEWLNASVAGTTENIPMGVYNAELSCDNGVIVANVTEPNLLGLNLVARISSFRNIAVSGKFKPDPSLHEEVHQASALFFTDVDADGYRLINL